MGKQQLLDEYSRVCQIIKLMNDQEPRDESRLSQDDLVTFAALIQAKIDYIDEIFAILDSLRLELNTNNFEISSSKIYSLLKEKVAFKSCGQAVFVAAKQKLMDLLLNEDSISICYQNILDTFNDDIKQAIETYRYYEIEHSQEYSTFMSDVVLFLENIDGNSIDETQLDKLKRLFINVFHNRLLFEDFFKEIIIRHQNEKEWLLEYSQLFEPKNVMIIDKMYNRIHSIIHHIAFQLINSINFSSFLGDEIKKALEIFIINNPALQLNEEDIFAIINRINAKVNINDIATYKYAADKVASYVLFNPEMFINIFNRVDPNEENSQKYIDDIIEAVKSEIINYFSNFESFFGKSIAYEISKQVVNHINNKLANAFSTEDAKMIFRKFTLEILGKYLSEEEINALADELLSKYYVESYYNRMINLTQTMERTTNLIEPLINGDQNVILLLSNSQDKEKLEEYKCLLASNEIGEDQLKTIIDCPTIVSAYEELRRDYLDYKNSLNFLLKKLNLGNSDGHNDELIAIVSEFIQEDTELFELTDLTKFMGDFFRKSLKRNQLVNDTKNNIQWYLDKTIRGHSLKNSNNQDLVMLYNDYYTEKRRSNYDSEERIGLSANMKLYYLLLQSLELCYQLLPLLENCSNSLLDMLEAIFLDANFNNDEINAIRDNAQNIRELFAKVSYRVDINLPNNDGNIKVIKKIIICVEKILDIIKSVCKNNNYDSLPILGVCRSITFANIAISSIISKYELSDFSGDKLIYLIKRKVPNSSWFNSKYANYLPEYFIANLIKNCTDTSSFGDEYINDEPEEEPRNDSKENETDKYSDDPDDYGYVFH